MTRRVLWSTIGACVGFVLVAAALVAWYRHAQRQAAAAEAARLEAEVAALKKTAADYRAQFEALLQAQQEALDKASGLF